MTVPSVSRFSEYMPTGGLFVSEDHVPAAIESLQGIIANIAARRRMRPRINGRLPIMRQSRISGVAP
jgi:hypothetical protein